MATVTRDGHVNRAIDFYNKQDSTYFVLGKSTAWEDETNPPVPAYTDHIEEVLGYKKAESVFLVREAPAGSVSTDPDIVTYQNSLWQIVSKDDAIELGARWVYIASYISFNELSVDLIYRQIGVNTGLVPNDDVPSGQYALTPEQVKEPGVLECIDNRRPVYRQADQQERIIIIIEF